MTHLARRLNPALSVVALFVALLALLAAAAGAGYAGASIGSKDLKKNSVTTAKIKKNAVTTKKIKNGAVTADKIPDGSLTASELAPEEKYRPAVLNNGGEGDCLYVGADTEVPGLGLPIFRKDRSGTVHLGGIAIRTDGPGGDGACDPSDPGQTSDAVAFTLPAGYAPFKTMYFSVGEATFLITGPQGLSSGGVSIPAGAVVPFGGMGNIVILDGLTFDAAGSPTVNRTAAPRGSVDLSAPPQLLSGR
jgi:hypothetical protein